MTKWAGTKIIVAVAFLCTVAAALIYVLSPTVSYVRGEADASTTISTIPDKVVPPPLDTVAYDKKMLEIANYGTTTLAVASSTGSTGSPQTATSTAPRHPWPVKAPYPKAGAILPFNRIVAYYGNFLSKGMGVLGQYPEDVMLAKLQTEVEKWQAADPTTPVVPAIHYIVVTAQGSPQSDGTYRLRMPDSQVDHALEIAKKINGIVFLDFQVGKSTVQKELPQYEQYLSLPNVHVGVDPEFSMKGKYPPGKEIGTLDAVDINWVANYLAGLVQEHDLPPKILMVHRFTEDMVTHTRQIAPLPEVQIIVDMDGWGDKAKKLGTYTNVVAAEPVQFTGFKLFYKNDLLPPSTGIFTPAELMKLTPRPAYIQYQ